MRSAVTKDNVKNKIDLGTKTVSYLTPVVLVGANVKEKPNFLPIGWFVGVGLKPLKVAVVLGKEHYTNQGIKKNKTFSVCIPSDNMVEATDFCGCFSGFKVDKSKVFDVFYGKLKTAPMITECPVNIECKLHKVLDHGETEMFIGNVVSTYTEEKYLTHGTVDITKTRPFILSSLQYYSLGETKGKAFNVGKSFKTRQERP
jgi:flavin reductase (DIM6/NTAB) family NADH-FMN oxidoreductase RutF